MRRKQLAHVGLVPFALIATSWGPRFNLGAAHLISFMLLMPGVAIIVWCFIDFVRGVILVALSEAVLSGRTLLFGYAVFLAVGYHLFVRFYEEPTLRRMFGEDYVQYCVWFRGGCLDGPLVEPVELSDDHAA